MKQSDAKEKEPGAAGDFRTAVLDCLPVCAGVAPFGIACGIMGIAAGLTTAEMMAMSLLVFAGAAQFIAISMLTAGITGWGMLVGTTLLVNLRHVLMGASLAPHQQGLPLFRQALLAFGLTDESYALTIGRIRSHGYSSAYQMGASTAVYVVWAVATAAGCGMGSRIPDPLAWGMDFIMPATFLALLIPRLTDRTNLAVCGVAALAAAAGAVYLPGKWYIIAATVAASVVGRWAEGGKNNAG
ncbi:MAG: AzlC family ABC transporter permease [bacterium]